MTPYAFPATSCQRLGPMRNNRRGCLNSGFRILSYSRNNKKVYHRGRTLPHIPAHNGDTLSLYLFLLQLAGVVQSWGPVLIYAEIIRGLTERKGAGSPFESLLRCILINGI